MAILDASKSSKLADQAEIRRLKRDLLILAQIAKVPDDKLVQFAASFVSTLKASCALRGDEPLDTLKASVKTLAKLQRAGWEYSTALLALPPVLRQLLIQGGLLQSVQTAQAVTLSVASAAELIKIASISQPRKCRGRPSKQIGAAGFTAFEAFVWSTLTHVYQARGSLSLNKNQKEGQLLRFLEFVREKKLLLPGFIPASLPVARLHRLKTDWRRKSSHGRFNGRIQT